MGDIRIDSYLSELDERCLAYDVLDGLTRPFKELPPKHFYDARGAELFDQICELPEYYPTRAERAILEARSAEIVAATGAAELVELGSGTAAKTRLLLRAMELIQLPGNTLSDVLLSAIGELRPVLAASLASTEMSRLCVTASAVHTVQGAIETQGLRAGALGRRLQVHADRQDRA